MSDSSSEIVFEKSYSKILISLLFNSICACLVLLLIVYADRSPKWWLWVIVFYFLYRTISFLMFLFKKYNLILSVNGLSLNKQFIFWKDVRSTGLYDARGIGFIGQIYILIDYGEKDYVRPIHMFSGKKSYRQLVIERMRLKGSQKTIYQTIKSYHEKYGAADEVEESVGSSQSFDEKAG